MPSGDASRRPGGYAGYDTGGISRPCGLIHEGSELLPAAFQAGNPADLASYRVDRMIRMSRNDIISRIRRHADAIRAEGATALYLFGSVARDEARADSDLDVFVDYDPKSKFSLVNLSGIRLLIMDAIGCNVDITTSNSLHPRLKGRILSEAVRVL
jgi:uncharacterized protein